MSFFFIGKLCRIEQVYDESWDFLCLLYHYTEVLFHESDDSLFTAKKILYAAMLC